MADGFRAEGDHRRGGSKDQRIRPESDATPERLSAILRGTSAPTVARAPAARATPDEDSTRSAPAGQRIASQPRRVPGSHNAVVTHMNGGTSASVIAEPDTTYRDTMNTQYGTATPPTATRLQNAQG